MWRADGTPEPIVVTVCTTAGTGVVRPRDLSPIVFTAVQSITFLTGPRHYTPLHTRHHTPRQTRSRCCQSVQRFRNTRMRSGNSRIKQIAGKCSPPKVALIYEGEWQVTALYSFDARTSCSGRLQQRRAKCPCVALSHAMHATGRCGCVFIVAFRVHACTGTSTALLARCVERSNLLSHVHTLRLALRLIQVLEH